MAVSTALATTHPGVPRPAALRSSGTGMSGNRVLVTNTADAPLVNATDPAHCDPATGTFSFGGSDSRYPWCSPQVIGLEPGFLPGSPVPVFCQTTVMIR